MVIGAADRAYVALEWTTSEDNLARIDTNASRRMEPGSVDQAEAFLKSERDKYTTIVRSLNLQPQ